MFGPHLTARLAHKRIRYALSNKRAYIATNWWGRDLTCYPIKPDALIEIKKGRLDQVNLHIKSEKDSDGNIVQISAEFIGQTDGTALFQLIRRLQAAQTGPA